MNGVILEFVNLLGTRSIFSLDSWEHYLLHNPEPHIFLFRRPLEKHAQSFKTQKLHSTKSVAGRRRSLRLAQKSDD